MMNKYIQATARPSHNAQRGFTIVELLIVIVVIAILAAISIVAYNGVQERARNSVVKSDLVAAGKRLELDRINNGTYPATLAAANGGEGVSASDGTLFGYTVDTSAVTYCLQASNDKTEQIYHVGSSRSVNEGGCTAVTGSYYTNMNLSGSPVATRDDGTINFNWALGSPIAGVGVDDFSVRWTGYFIAPTTGTYTFYATSDDGQRLYVGGSLIINDWIDHGSTERTATASLTAGQTYSFTYEMYENGGDAVGRLEWLTPGRSRAYFPG